LSGSGLKNWKRPARKYYQYREDVGEFDIDKLRDQKDDDNEEIDGEWFSDGKWEMDDEQAELDDEDWEQWDDWFPPEDV